MSCTFAHNTNLSLISLLGESLETELSAFHQWNFFFSPSRPVCDEVYRVSHKGLGNIQMPACISGVRPCKWNLLAARPCYGCVTECGAKCPKHTFSPQITCELFFFNDRPLPHYWLTVCSRFGEIHLKAIQDCCGRQEVSVLAQRVIHSVSCTQRGLSSLVSLLSAFKECMCM